MLNLAFGPLYEEINDINRRGLCVYSVWRQDLPSGFHARPSDQRPIAASLSHHPFLPTLALLHSALHHRPLPPMLALLQLTPLSQCVNHAAMSVANCPARPALTVSSALCMVAPTSGVGSVASALEDAPPHGARHAYVMGTGRCVRSLQATGVVI